MPVNMDHLPTPTSQNSTTDRAKNSTRVTWVRHLLRITSVVAPPVAVRLAHALFFTPERLPVRPEQRAVLARGTQQRWMINDQPLVGWTWGQGPPIALVHGWSAHAAFMTAFVAPCVQAGFRVVAWDMPAHGGSGGRRSSIVHFAAALEHVAAAVGPLHGIVAHSLGTTATLSALARGLQVERAVLVAPPAHVQPLWARICTALGVSPHIWDRMLNASERWLKTDFATLEPLHLAQQVRVPTLVLHDADDQEIPLTDGETLAHALPSATFQRSDGLGHRRILRDSTTITAAVRFLAAVPAR